MSALGERVGVARQADTAVRNLQAQLKRVSDRVRGLKRPRTMLIFGRERGALRGIYASGGRGFLHDVLELAGGDDVFKDVDRESVQVTSELALARAPEAIIELHPDVQLDNAAIAREQQVWRPLASIPAVRNDRIYLLTGPELVLAGPRIGEVAERFASVLHPR
jgi:iron complex transport system substrate-binding protein